MIATNSAMVLPAIRGFARLFGADGRVRPALVVVRGPDGGRVGEREQDLRDASVQRLGAAGLEVRAPAAVDQQRVAGEHVLAPQVTHAARRVPGRVHGALICSRPKESVSPSLSCTAAVVMPQPSGAAVLAPACSASWPALVMWSACACVSTVQASLQAALPQQCEIALDLLVHGVDDERHPASRRRTAHTYRCWTRDRTVGSDS